VAEEEEEEKEKRKKEEEEEKKKKSPRRFLFASYPTSRASRTFTFVINGWL